MICNECENKQFFSKRKEHKVIALVCDNCKNEVPIKAKKSIYKIDEEEISEVSK